MKDTDWLDAINWDDKGLVPAIAQDSSNGKVLTLAWMNREALERTLAEKRAIYWSRSRNRIWRKGEASGHIQTLRSLRLDCDNDCLLLEVEQAGGIACHTGRESCFYQELKDGNWKTVEPVIRDPEDIYS